MQWVDGKDDLLRKYYAQIPEAVDEIVGDPEILTGFLNIVNAELPQTDQFSQRELAKRLFTLRKRGEGNNGLPRKHRQFNGRNKKPR